MNSHKTMCFGEKPEEAGFPEFSCILRPAQERAAGDRPAVQAAGVATRPLRILIVDDNAINLQVAAGIVRRLKHSCVLASNAREALAAVGPEIDIVLMDIQMPGMDGFELTRRIHDQERSTGRKLPVIAVTASDLSDIRDLARESGMNACIAKPLRAQELSAAIEQASLATRLERS